MLNWAKTLMSLLQAESSPAVHQLGRAACLQSPAKVSDIVFRLERDTQRVHRSPAVSKLVGVGCGCHASVGDR